MSRDTSTYFPLLPGEIRNQIWTLCLRESQIIPATIHSKPNDSTAITPRTDTRAILIPYGPSSALRQVCKESRSLALSIQQPYLLGSPPKNIFLDVDNDIIWLPKYKLEVLPQSPNPWDDVMGYEEWSGPNIARLALPIQCLIGELRSGRYGFTPHFLLTEGLILRLLKEIHRKRVKELFFVFETLDAGTSWSHKFRSPRQSPLEIFSVSGDTNLLAHDILEAMAKGEVVLTERQGMTWDIVEKSAIAVLEQAVTAYFKLFMIMWNTHFCKSLVS